MITLVSNNKSNIAALCRAHRIRRLEVFGSAATGSWDPNTSDVDFIVDLGDYEEGIASRDFRFAEGLEALLGRPVDLVTEPSIQNP